MKYIIVTQTYPPRIGGMQNVMTSISKRLSSIEDTHVFPDHFLSKKNGYIFERWNEAMGNGKII